MSEAGPWRVDADLLVRTTSLPVSALQVLTFPGSIALIDDLLARESWLAAEGEVLSEALFEIIGALGEHPERRTLVGLRRSLHQAQIPSAREWSTCTAALLPDRLAQRVRGWTTRAQDARRIRSQLPAVLDAEKAVRLAGMRTALGHDEFRHALSFAGPTLLDELDKWRADETRPPQAQKILRLARYASRAAAKTSPYSTFMLNGFGSWGAPDQAAAGTTSGTADQPVRFRTAPESIRVLDLDGAYLQALRRALVLDPVLAENALIRVNPSVTEVDGTIYFLARPPDEAVVGLRATAGLAGCLRAVADQPGASLAGLRMRLTPAGTGTDPDAVTRFIGRLLEVGLLEMHPPVPEQAPDPLADLAAWVLRSAPGSEHGLGELILTLRSQLRRDIPIEQVQEEQRRGRQVRAAMDRLAGRLDLEATLTGASLDPPVHEMAVAPGDLAVCAVGRWRTALSDLDVVRRFLKVFDSKLPVQVAVGAYCREQFGAGARVPLLVLHRAILHELSRAPETDAGPGARDLRALLGSPSAPPALRPAERLLGRLHELDAIRARAREAVLPAPDPDGVVRVEPAVLAGHLDDWPAWIVPPTSMACYVQRQSGSGPVRLVLNVAHGGHGRGRTRLQYQLGRTRPDHRSDPDHRGEPVPAELGGLHGSSLNLREPGARYEIDYPFTLSARPVDERLTPADLMVVHNRETDLVELHSARLGAPITPLHLGMSSEFALPPLARFIERVFGTSYLLHPSAPPLMDVASLAGERVAAQHPRVEVGRVVVQRARWLRSASDIPTRGTGKPDAGYLVRLIDWLARNGIPRHAYVRAWGTDLSGKQSKARKPVFIDFSNWFLVLDFERLVSASEFVRFDEALPDPLDPHGPDRVSEFVVELSDGDDDA